HPGAGVGRQVPARRGARPGLCLERHHLSQPDRDRLCHDRHAVVRPSLLWPAQGETNMTTKPTKRVRCAVYTRVSTEYGLDQEFNSLLHGRTMWPRVATVTFFLL